MYVRGLAVTVAVIALIAAAEAQVKPADPDFEGDWFVADSTNNNTGEREVSAFRTEIGEEFVSLRMTCSSGNATFFVEWNDQTFPDQTVVTLGPSADAGSDPVDRQYVFAKATDIVEHGLRASPETSAKIVAALGDADYVRVTAYPTSGKRSVGMDIHGTQLAWARVSRHCPVRKMATPPK